MHSYLDTIGGVLFAKLLNLFRKEKINLMIGAAGNIRIPHVGQSSAENGTERGTGKYYSDACSRCKCIGQIASVIAGGLVISLVTRFL